MIRTVLRSLVLALALALALAAPASAQDPTPTALPTLDYTPIPTGTLEYTPAPTPAGYEITGTEAISLGLELDASLWDYDTYDSFKQSARTWLDLANQYHVISLIFGVAIAAIVIGAATRLISSRGMGRE